MKYLSEGIDCFASLPEVLNHGVMIFDPVWAVSEHVSTNAELLYILNGSETLHVEGREYRAESGDIVLVPPGVPHRDEFDLTKDFSVFMLSFAWDSEALRLFCDRVSNDALLALSDADKARIIESLESFRVDDDCLSDVGVLILNTKLLETLLLIYELSRGNSESGNVEITGKRGKLLMKRAKEYCAQHLSEPLCLDMIAAALEVSPFHLSRVFSAESNFSLFSYLTHLRMERAKELLEAGDKLVSDVAYAVGYSDGNYFSKAFRNYFGESPSACLGRRLMDSGKDG